MHACMHTYIQNKPHFDVHICRSSEEIRMWGQCSTLCYTYMHTYTHRESHLYIHMYVCDCVLYSPLYSHVCMWLCIILTFKFTCMYVIVYAYVCTIDCTSIQYKHANFIAYFYIHICWSSEEIRTWGQTSTLRF